MTHWIFWQILGFFGAVVYASFFEWTLHRYIMHKNWSFFSYPFRSHAIVHHTVFKADATYHVQKETDKRIVPMAWWNAPILWSLHIPLFLFVQYLIGAPIFWGMMAAMICYYFTYEYMHWCMHIPKNRHVEHSPIYFRLNGHHLLHHRYMHKNYNVVMPLADLLLGTLLLRSPISFAQPIGHCIPHVQPKEKKLTKVAVGNS
ncbi:MAG: fatty acid hydroxylase [Verrucomicrobiota bacterium]|nr:fatty acid hydroxylase [Verrucomicrobiota bacterium]